MLKEISNWSASHQLRLLLSTELTFSFQLCHHKNNNLQNNILSATLGKKLILLKPNDSFCLSSARAVHNRLTFLTLSF